MDHDSHVDGLSLSAVDLHRHGCLPLLGAFSYLPMSGESSDSHDKSPISWETLVAVSTVQSVGPVSRNVAMNHWWLAAFANLAADHCCPAENHEIRSLGVALASPLCDRARHERSGVLLA
ncbi:MAG TPA: hypothetical protein VJL29_15975 [Thermoguttaceae bacterium]|nr:hypothetical protein [Thermoguttaceae bacterium]